MCDREAARVEFGEQRLHIAQDCCACRGVAYVADRGGARQPLDRRGVREVIADQTEPTLGVEAHAVEGDDARRFLSAVLQRVEPERGDRRRVGVAKNAKDAAFFSETILVGIEDRRRGVRRSHGLAGVGAAAGGAFLLISASSFCLSPPA